MNNPPHPCSEPLEYAMQNEGEPNAASPDAVTLFTQFAPRIAALPDGDRLMRGDLLVPDFLLEQAGRLAIYYAPFDYINPQAKIALVGITPGFRQMEISLRESRDALRRGTPIEAVVAHVKYQASFAGPIRRFLIAMLDGIGLPQALGIATCAALYADRADLLHTSAVVRHPVFVNGKDWTGHTPPVRSNPLLRRYLTEVMLPELQAVPDALLISLGKCASDALATHIATGALDPARCLIGLPHPSGANGHRYTQFAAARDDLTARVAAWVGRSGA
jgi:hypothetical protein